METEIVVLKELTVYLDLDFLTLERTWGQHNNASTVWIKEWELLTVKIDLACLQLLSILKWDLPWALLALWWACQAYKRIGTAWQKNLFTKTLSQNMIINTIQRWAALSALDINSTWLVDQSKEQVLTEDLTHLALTQALTLIYLEDCHHKWTSIWWLMKRR
jgi:hypothetical protein